MKRVKVGLLLAIMAISSCSINPIDEGTSFSTKKVPVTIKAAQVDESATKTIRNLDKSVSWMPSDEIAIFIGTEKAKFTSTNTENELTASFNGELSESTVNSINNGTNTHSVWGLYPYDENATCDGNSVTTTLPSQQTGVAGTFADDLFITVAQSSNFNMYFYNVCSGFKFSITKEGITSMTIQGKNNEDIAGKIKISFVDGRPTAEVLEGIKTITLTPEGDTFEVGKDYYFVMLPSEFTQGFKVSLNTMSQTGIFDYSKSVDFPRSKFVNKSNMDENVEYGAKEGNIYIPDANFKTYLVENFDSNNDGEISLEEAETIDRIRVDSNGIETLQGIEFFSNLTSLNCSLVYYAGVGGIFYNSQNEEVSGKISSLDVSNNTKLAYLNFSGNQISSLNLDNNPALEQLRCDYNQLSDLNLCNNTELTHLNCNYNQISELDLSSNTALQQLDCSYNQISELDLSSNTALQQLNCSYNQISELDLSSNTALQQLDCYHNELNEIDLSNKPDLWKAICGDNPIVTIVIPESVTHIGIGGYNGTICDNAFSSCITLTSITILGKITAIGKYAFSNCFGLTSITIPKSVTSIDDSAFYNCIGLTSITIPEGVTSIGNKAFYACRGLTSITVQAVSPPALASDGFKETNCPINVPSESVDAYKTAERWREYASRIQAIQE